MVPDAELNLTQFEGSSFEGSSFRGNPPESKLDGVKYTAWKVI